MQHSLIAIAILDHKIEMIVLNFDGYIHGLLTKEAWEDYPKRGQEPNMAGIMAVTRTMDTSVALCGFNPNMQVSGLVVLIVGSTQICCFIPAAISR